MSKGIEMKISAMLLLLLLFSLTFLLCSCSAGLEKPKYTVLEKQDNLEIRSYQSYIVAETTVDSDFTDASNVAFRKLFKYISGNNKAKESISMTAPVNQTSTSEKISMTAPVSQQLSGRKYSVSFVMPSKYSIDTIPQPLDPQVTIKQIPAHKAAAIRYAGSWSQKLYEAKKTALEQFIDQKEMTPKENPIFARYNSPFELWFLRRNEIIIPVE